MKLINPSEISGQILTLLEQSDEWVTIVSPYMKISKWYKLLNKLNNLKAKSIPIEIFVRDDQGNEETYHDLEQLELEYQKIPHLHSKLYMNEKYGIVSSMNLLLSSEINSLEIGYLTETKQEYEELLRYHHRYINREIPVNLNTNAGQFADIQEIMSGVQDKLIKIEKLTAMKTELLPKTKGKERQNTQKSTQKTLQQINGQTQGLLESTCMTRIVKTEANFVVDSIIRFTKAVDELRS